MKNLKSGEFETKNKQELSGTEVFEKHIDFLKDKKPSVTNHKNYDCALHVKNCQKGLKTSTASH
jgi:hypothetical protein